jgi:hypothetical protein
MSIDTIWVLEDDFKAVDSVSLFKTEMYISRMHSRHNDSKTSLFKQCLFLKHIKEANITDCLVAAVETCLLPLCYLYLLQDGRAVGDVVADATAFGCQYWDFVCVITGVWPCDQDSTEAV